MTDPKEAKRLHNNRLAAIRNERRRAKQSKAGMERKEIWVFPHLWGKVKLYVAKLNRGE